MLIAFAAITLISIVLLRFPGPRFAFHKFILSMPGIKRLSRSLNTARMARTLAILIGSGVPLLSALKSAADVLMNVVMRKQLLTVSTEVEQGASLSRALSRSRVFPALFTQMVSSGESSGRLAEMLAKSASALEKSLSREFRLLSVCLNPS